MEYQSLERGVTLLQITLKIQGEYFVMKKPSNENNLIFKFCEKVLRVGIYRVKQHLAGGYKNVAACTRVPSHVLDKIKNYMDGKKMEKLEEMRNILEENVFPK